MRRLLIPALAITLTACSDNGGGIIDLNRTGTLLGIAYVDRDADGRLTQTDAPAPGVVAALILPAGDTIARATAGNDGIFIMSNVPVGNYTLVARLGTLGDTLQLQKIDTAFVAIAAGDTIRRSVRIGYPLITTEAAKALNLGRRVVLEGLALNSWAAFADSTLHIYDATGVIRALRVVPSPVQTGDSIRIMGVTGVNNGRPVLVDVGVQVLAGGRTVPPPDSVSTQRAATALGGTRPDGLVRIAGALVRDTATVGNFRRVGVDDGSGRLEVMLHRGLAYPLEAAQPGALLNATGLLTPAATGTGWVLRPRGPADVSATFPTSTIAQLRTMPLGNRVFVEGIALNGWATYGDSTVHVVDRTGSIRAVRVQPSGLLAGDSIRILGTTGLRDGRLTLVDAAALIVATARGLPAPDSVSTAVAASAAGGARADGQVRIGNAIIRDTATVAGELVLGVDDGSGRLEVVLDRHISFNPGPWVPGGTFRGAGVLVPAPTGTQWQLKPRDRNEAAIVFPTITVAEARVAEQGRRVIIEGLALNAWSTFGDSTVHVLDRTGAMRAVRVTGAQVLAGDSVRLLGTVASREQQPVLTSVTATLISRGVQLPRPDSVSTAVAASAGGGTRDGNQVRVSGTILGSQQRPDGDNVFTIDDGSGRLDVVFDRDITFGSGAYSPGAILTATGVLVPTGTGTWQLKPRSSADVTSTFPTVSIAQARELPPGRIVYVHGLALNGWVTFSDQSVHLFDRNAAIRVVNMPQAQIFAGDSIRVLGSISTRNGQPVIIGGQASVLLAGVGLPAPDSISTAVAAHADSARRDAHQVLVRGRIVRIDTIAVNERRLHITDGSDSLAVFLDRNVGFPVGAYRENDWVRVRGVLVPAADGVRWELRPRSVSEIAVTAAPASAAFAPVIPTRTPTGGRAYFAPTFVAALFPE